METEKNDLTSLLEKKGHCQRLLSQCLSQSNPDFTEVRRLKKEIQDIEDALDDLSPDSIA